MKISTQLRKQASALAKSNPAYVSVQMLKQAGYSDEEARVQVSQHLMEKEAASALVAQGIDYDEAVKLVKIASVDIRKLPSFKIEKTAEELVAESLEKLASEVEALEAKATEADSLLEKVAELQEIVDASPKSQGATKAIEKLAGTSAFTNEDLEALMRLPGDVLTKVASVQDEPMSMGRASGISRSSQDPLVAFLMS